MFANYAKHHETGEAMPQALVDKITKVRTFNRGYATVECPVRRAAGHGPWHTLPAGDAKKDVDAFEREALAKYKVDMVAVPPRYRTNYFSHIWGGYAAEYYSYFGAEVLDHDTFQWFRENGGMTRENGQVFREKILSIGQSRGLGTPYREFRGKEPSVEPLLEHRGLK